MVSALLFASRYTSQKSKLKIKGSKNNPHFLGSRPSIRPEPGPRFWTLKTQKYPHMLFAKWFYKFQVPSYSLRKVTKILGFCGKWDSLASTEYQKVSNIFHQEGLVELDMLRSSVRSEAEVFCEAKPPIFACQHKPAHPPQSFAPPACGMLSSY